jgi:carbon dioxide concentrating mechanism protein CcmM
MSDISDSVRQQIRQLLSQGYRVGLEYADARRFRTGSWQSAAVAQGNESTVLNGIATVLAEHQGEYVQLLGVDTHSRTRVLELMIQRPDGAVTQVSSTKINGGKTVAAASNGQVSSNGGQDVAQSVRQLLSQGYRIGTEFADARRYRATSWTSGPSYQGTREAEAIAMLSELVANHPDDYVRAIGIDTHARRRVSEFVIHKPGEPATLSSGGGSSSQKSSSFSSAYGGSSASSNIKTSLSAEVVASVRRLLENSYQISTEHADLRRFRSSSWHTCKPVSATRLQDAVAQLETCLNDHEGEYGRSIGIEIQSQHCFHPEIGQLPQK